MAKKKPIKKRRKSSRPTQKQSQKQIVNITFADKKKQRKSTGVKKNNLQLAVQSLSSNLNMFSSDTQRLNNLENLITELRKEQRQLITLGRPTPKAITNATDFSEIETQTMPTLKKTQKTQTRMPDLETPEPLKLKLKTKVSIPKQKRKPYETKGKKADLFYKEGLMRKAMEGFKIMDTQQDDDLLKAELDEPIGFYGGGTKAQIPILSDKQMEINISAEKKKEERAIRKAKAKDDFIRERDERFLNLLGAEEI